MSVPTNGEIDASEKDRVTSQTGTEGQKENDKEDNKEDHVYCESQIRRFSQAKGGERQEQGNAPREQEAARQE